jgi:hypothetical protein
MFFKKSKKLMVFFLFFAKSQFIFSSTSVVSVSGDDPRQDLVYWFMENPRTALQRLVFLLLKERDVPTSEWISIINKIQELRQDPCFKKDPDNSSKLSKTIFEIVSLPHVWRGGTRLMNSDYQDVISQYNQFTNSPWNDPRNLGVIQYFVAYQVALVKAKADSFVSPKERLNLSSYFDHPFPEGDLRRSMYYYALTRMATSSEISFDDTSGLGIKRLTDLNVEHLLRELTRDQREIQLQKLRHVFTRFLNATKIEHLDLLEKDIRSFLKRDCSDDLKLKLPNFFAILVLENTALRHNPLEKTNRISLHDKKFSKVDLLLIFI